LAFTATAAWSANIFQIGNASPGDFIFKLAFVWLSIIVAIVSLKHGKWIPNAGGFMRIFVLGFFTLTLVVYAIRHGVHGFPVSDLSPTRSIFLALVPILLFNYVGFELQNGAGEEMENPEKDVPIAVLWSGLIGVSLYVVPILGILLVLPAKAISNISGFIDAVTTTFNGAYGGAAHFLLIVMTLCFVGTLLTSGAVWMIGSDRIQAAAAYDGAFFPWFGVFNRRFGTPVRVNLMSGVASSLFCIAAIELLKNQSTSAAFTVVLYMAISTTLLSYLWIFPAVLKLRYTHPHVRRPYVVPFGTAGIWIATILTTGWIALGTWVAIFPGVLEKIFNVPYNFQDSWGLSRGKFELYTLGTLAVIIAFGVVGYITGAGVRRQIVQFEADTPEPIPAD
ncbi:MAG: amino acid permease, partial [Actinomycetia bacterium]|nr:amino acid permease [Actinomycetes bacterium]